MKCCIHFKLDARILSLKYAPNLTINIEVRKLFSLRRGGGEGMSQLTSS